jgi:Exopolyphosphatase-related proteins
MQVTIPEARALLAEQDNIVILAHRKPDGDAMGCAIALYHALTLQGKACRIECADPFSSRYNYLNDGYLPKDFEPDYIVAVDLADEQLLGDLQPTYAGRIDLCIDHHKSNTFYAKHTLVEEQAAAAAETLFKLLLEMGTEIDGRIANALFTGLSTDTGGFRFANVTAETHRAAARLIDLGAEHVMINQAAFGTRSRARLGIERLVLQSLEYYCGGLCALIALPPHLRETYGATEDDLEGISNLLRTIEGVYVGVAIRDNGDGSFRLSLRSKAPADVSAICAGLGGGGHTSAAGCTLMGTLGQVKQALLARVEAELQEKGIGKAK